MPLCLEYPTFGFVAIFVPDDMKQLLVCLYKTEAYSTHYAYEVVKTCQFCVIPMSQLGIHEVYHEYCITTAPDLYVVIKSYHIMWGMIFRCIY